VTASSPTSTTAGRDTAPSAADYLVLALICASAVLAGLLELLLVPHYVDGHIFPISVPLAMITTYALPKLGFWLIGQVRGAALPLVFWIVPVLTLGFLGRPEGDLIIEGGNNEQWVALAMIVAGAVVGFVVISVGTLPTPSPRER
jgi:hypothetical protein